MSNSPATEYSLITIYFLYFSGKIVQMPERYTFTFFPDTAEQKYIAEAAPAEITELLNQQPEMSGRFMHELLRNNRDQDAIAAIQPVMSETLLRIMLGDVKLSTSMMCAMHGIDTEEGRRFTTDVLGVLRSVDNGKTLRQTFSSFDPAVLEEQLAERIMQRVQDDIQKYRTNLRPL